MSVWARFKALWGGEAVSGASSGPSQREPRESVARGAEPATSASAAGTSAGRPDSRLDDASRRLAALGERDEVAAHEQADALEAFETLIDAGRELFALDLGRQVLRRGALPALRCRVAERLDARGDEAEARAILEPIVGWDEAPLDGLMLLAELAERRSDERGALALYERVVAREFDYPRARERVVRLRERVARPQRDDGVTLMGAPDTSRGRYRLVRELGRGGAGTIFLADDTELSRRVALKVYHRRGRVERERLLKEARLAASLEHPGVVRVLDVDETLGAIVMEVVSGGSVRDRLASRPALADVLAWFESALDALAYVHARGLVHRDVKPSNLLLRDDRTAVLTDFGIAQRLGAVDGLPLAEGSLGYMPKEQRAGSAPHPSMDVFALGVTLREMVASTGATSPRVDALVAACTTEDARARIGLAPLRAAVRDLPRG